MKRKRKAFVKVLEKVKDYKKKEKKKLASVHLGQVENFNLFLVLFMGSMSHPKPDTRICDHDRHANIKPKPDINKNQLNFLKTFTKAFLFPFIPVSLLK